MTEPGCPDLSIVIVSYNVRDLLRQCLESLCRQQIGIRTVEPEVFVVDNASNDKSAAMVRTHFPSFHLVENTTNRGFAAANNQAFLLTRGRYVLMLNPDTTVAPDTLGQLVEFMDEHPRAGACGGKLLYPDGRLQHSAFRFPTLAQIWFDFFPMNWRLLDSRLNGRYPRALYARDKPFEVDHLLGADLLVRRDAAEQVGWLDDQFFIYCEEIDWCMRLRGAGWRIWCVPAAEIVHHEAQSTRQFREAMFVQLWRSRTRLFEKHYSPAFRWTAGQIIRLGMAQLERQAQAAERKGQISREEMASRLSAYAQISRLQA